MNALSAREGIAQGLARYCRAMDRMDDALGLSVFHDDATVDYQPDLFVGRASDFITWVHRLHEGFDATSHRIANVLVEEQRGRALSEAYGHVQLFTRLDGDRVHIRRSLGRYIDRWTRVDGRWVVTHRDYLRDATHEEVVIGASIHAHREATVDPFLRGLRELGA